jgi:putative lipoic acid-binding regulatory protein
MDDLNSASPSCSKPFGNAQLEYPLHFDVRIIYTISEQENFQKELEKALLHVEVPCSMIQGIAKPGAKYGRMGARVTVDSKKRMDSLYAAIAAIPGVKAVI